MRQLSEKHIMLIIAGAGLLLAGGAFGGVYWAKSCIEQEKARISDLDGKIAEAEKKKERIAKDEEEVIILRENVAEYVKILPESAELTDYQRTIQSFATNSGVVLSSVTPGTTSGGKTSAFTQIQYNLSFRATLWQFMKFLNMFESYRRFVKVTSFRLEGGKAVKGNAADDVVHQFSLSVVTYTYNQQAGEKKPVKIANYNAKRDRLREDIYRERQNIKIDRYGFKGPRSRRDVFVDPRLDGDIRGQIGSVTLEDQLKTIEGLVQQLNAIQQRYEQALKTAVIILRFEMIRDVKTQILELSKKIEEVEQRQTISYRPYQLRFQRDVLDPRDALQKLVFKGADEKSETGLPMEELTGIRRFMEDAVTEGNLEGAVDKFELVREKLTFPANDPRYQVKERLEDIYRKAKTAQDFQRLNLQVSGVIMIEDGLSTAIINGKTFSEGDALADHLFLKEIGAEYVEFLFRGVVLRMKR